MDLCILPSFATPTEDYVVRRLQGDLAVFHWSLDGAQAHPEIQRGCLIRGKEIT